MTGTSPVKGDLELLVRREMPQSSCSDATFEPWTRLWPGTAVPPTVNPATTASNERPPLLITKVFSTIAPPPRLIV
jgi:hypothetical protein